jgi:predicted nuclease of predicted toxin-antitoxin system
VTVWLDAHLSPALAPWLESNFQLSALPVRDLGLRDAQDHPIFTAAKEAHAIVMTKDADFAELVERLGPPPQVIWLRCGNTSNEELRSLFAGRLREVLDRLAVGEPIVEL